MAASISFGIAFATIWILLLVPSIYRTYAVWDERIARRFGRTDQVHAADMPATAPTPRPGLDAGATG